MQTIEYDRYGVLELLTTVMLADPEPGAAGYGDPRRRAHALVMQDLRDEKISAASAGDHAVAAATTTAGGREGA
ncbi:MAG: hypothetical protein HHJ12_06235 [Glaciimonas sp.]|nr:hypothetical protein [Glaciimonas sp.]